MMGDDVDAWSAMKKIKLYLYREKQSGMKCSSGKRERKTENNQAGYT